MLEAQQLAAQRGPVTLFAKVDFALGAGEALIVTGGNGSGKTTLLRIAAGLTHPTQGTLRWRGVVVRPFDARLRAATLFVGHAAALEDGFTAEENLLSLATLHEAPSTQTAVTRAAVRRALQAWSLDGQRNLPARVLSQGQRRRVGLARLNLTRRPLWLLDEPTTALDAAGVVALLDLIRAHLGRGGVAVIATHQTLALGAGSTRTLSLS